MSLDAALLSPPEGTAGSNRDAFLSYASRDGEVALRVCALLESAGISVWMAPRDVPGGANYADAIVRAINGCRTLLVILSAHSVSSAHVGKEIERASSKRRPIVAIRLDDTELTPALEYFLSESQWIDARAGLPAALPKLIDSIRRISAPGSAPVPAVGTRPLLPAAAPSAQPAAVRRRGLLVPLGVVAVVLIGALLAWRSGWLRRPPQPVAAVAASAAAPAAAAPAAPSNSIAVLPFADLSEKKDQEYFSDGLSEELIDLLGKVPGLRVPARTSSFYFKGKQATLAEIGKALNVSHVLEGSVRKSGKQLRITTELVSVGDDTRIWSETYDRQLDDVFKVQDDIANSVVTALKVSMLGEAVPRATPTANSDAYLHYLLALESLRSEGGGFEQTDSELRKAVQLDPNFAQAWLLLGTLHINGFVGGSYGPYEVARREAMNALQRALAINPSLAEAHVEQARVFFQMDFDTPAAQAELKRAAALDPTGRAALWLAGYIANSEGRYDEAIALHLKSREVDPLFYDNYRQLGNAYYRAGRYEEAAAALNEAAQRFPTARTVHYRLGLVRLLQHQPQQALDEFNREQDGAFKQLGPPLALDALGRRAESDRILNQALATQTTVDAAAYQIALIYANRGDADAAFHWLQRALEQRDAGMHWMKFDPLLQGLRSDPRFQALLLKMHQA
jgi:TolB-like protein/tetratricopeptide (TPR) repeat protein